MAARHLQIRQSNVAKLQAASADVRTEATLVIGSASAISILWLLIDLMLGQANEGPNKRPTSGRLLVHLVQVARCGSRATWKKVNGPCSYEPLLRPLDVAHNHSMCLVQQSRSALRIW